MNQWGRVAAPSPQTQNSIFKTQHSTLNTRPPLALSLGELPAKLTERAVSSIYSLFTKASPPPGILTVYLFTIRSSLFTFSSPPFTPNFHTSHPEKLKNGYKKIHISSKLMHAAQIWQFFFIHIAPLSFSRFVISYLHARMRRFPARKNRLMGRVLILVIAVRPHCES